MSESGGFRLDCAKGHEAAEGCAAAAAAVANVPREGGLPKAERPAFDTVASTSKQGEKDNNKKRGKVSVRVRTT